MAKRPGERPVQDIHFTNIVRIGPCVECGRPAQEHVVTINRKIGLAPLCNPCLRLREQATIAALRKRMLKRLAFVLLVVFFFILGFALGLLSEGRLLV